MQKIKTRYRQLLNDAINSKRWNSNSTVRQLVGLPREKFRMYLESQFTDEMTWENFGTYWYLKFRTPLKEAKSESELVQLFHFLNIYPHERSNPIIPRRKKEKTR